MEFNMENDGDKLTVIVKGRIDTTTTPELEKAFEGKLDDTKELILDFSELEYISSAGLRLLLFLQKTQNASDGTLTICNVNDFVLEVFEMTGFKDILTIV